MRLLVCVLVCVNQNKPEPDNFLAFTCFQCNWRFFDINFHSQLRQFVCICCFVPYLAMRYMSISIRKWKGKHKYLRMLNGMQTFGVNENVITNNNWLERNQLFRHDSKSIERMWNVIRWRCDATMSANARNKYITRYCWTKNMPNQFCQNNGNWCGFA